MCPNWKKIITSGSDAHLNSLDVAASVTVEGDISGSSTSTGSFGHGYIDGKLGIGTASPDSHVHISSSVGSSTASLHIEGSGSSVVSVDGTQGRLFTVSDEMSGSIFSANTIAGLPVIEAFSDSKVTLGPYSNQVEITSDGDVSGSSTSTGSFGRVHAADKLAVGTTTVPSGVTAQIQSADDTKLRVATANSSFYAELKASVSNDTPLQIIGRAGDVMMKQRTADTEIEFLTNNTTRMYIDKFGAVTAPNQPAFSYYRTSSLTSLGNNIETLIKFPTMIFDQGSDYDVATGKFNAPTGGRYLFGVTLRLEDITTSADYI